MLEDVSMLSILVCHLTALLSGGPQGEDAGHGEKRMLWAVRSSSMFGLAVGYDMG